MSSENMKIFNHEDKSHEMFNSNGLLEKINFPVKCASWFLFIVNNDGEPMNWLCSSSRDKTFNWRRMLLSWLMFLLLWKCSWQWMYWRFSRVGISLWSWSETFFIFKWYYLPVPFICLFWTYFFHHEYNDILKIFCFCWLRNLARFRFVFVWCKYVSLSVSVFSAFILLNGIGICGMCFIEKEWNENETC